MKEKKEKLTTELYKQIMALSTNVQSQQIMIKEMSEAIRYLLSKDADFVNSFKKDEQPTP